MSLGSATLVLSGLATALAFPSSFFSYRLPDLGLLAWVALVPLFLRLETATSLRKSFCVGLGFGFLLYGVSCYWVFIALHDYGEVGVVASLLGLAGVALIFASLLGFVSALAVWLKGRGIPLFLGLSLTWVAHDFLRTSFPFGGFPWSSLAYSQGGALRILQIADLTGVYGVTFLILLTNGVLARCWGLWRGGQVKQILWPLLGLGGMLLLDLGYGSWRIDSLEARLQKMPTARLALVQGNVPQDEKWLGELADSALHRHLYYTDQVGPARSGPARSGPARSRPERSEAAQSESVDLVIWPEAAYPMVLGPDDHEVPGLEEIPVPVLMGVVTFEGFLPEDWPPPPGTDTFKLYNSAVLVGLGGKRGPAYHKHHLVPFGEYVPGQRWLFFVDKLVPGMSSFTPGPIGSSPAGPGPARVGPRLLPSPVGSLGVAICYEDIFPALTRDLVRAGAGLLVNLTNDAWYNQASMAYQHLEYSRLRAIENRRSVVRATNTGMTAIINPVGKIVASLPPFAEGVLVHEVVVSDLDSFLTRHGDWFAWLCVVLLGICVLRGIRDEQGV